VKPRRGEIWLVDFGQPVGREQAGTRPALVVSADPLNEGSAGIIIVVPITTARRDLPSHIEIDRDESGLEEISYAKCEDVKSISDERFIARIGVAPVDAVFAVGRILRYLLDL
jgi:mRNA interferase MazF